MLDKIIKCACCGEPYMIYSMYAGDQSACPECREKVRLKMEKNDQEAARKLIEKFGKMTTQFQWRG